jgi:predicted nucleotide-binding protein
VKPYHCHEKVSAQTDFSYTGDDPAIFQILSATIVNNYDLRISNYNYDVDAFLARIRDRFSRDDRLLSTVLVRSALTRAQGGDVGHIITRIDVLGQSVQMDTLPNVLDYGPFVFTRENLTKESILERLMSGFAKKEFQICQWTVKSGGMGFQDYYEPSGNQYSPWPCTVFQISFGRAQFAFDPLIHPKLKTFPSPYEAIRENLGLVQFNDSSDSRLGSIILSVPNLNGRIEELVLKRNKLIVRFSGAAQPNSLKLDGTYKNDKQAASIERYLDSEETVLDLSFVPSQLQLWLISTAGFLADFHEENEYYSRGANPVLPKKEAAPVGSLQLESREEFEPAYAVGSLPSRVFIIHGHNISVKESVARFLEKLGLEAIILHEQPNKGNTVIEKFELHAEVNFAIALMTGDDEARIASSSAPLKRRPRQNVLFEFGYFIGKLGRNHVCALVEKDVEIPSDYHGVVYIDLDPAGHWKFDLVRELKAAGFDVDANLAI